MTAAFVVTLSGAAVGAHAATIDTLYVTGGEFSMGVFTPTPNVFEVTDGGFNLVGGYSSPAWDVNTAQGSAATGSIVSFNFNQGGTWVNTYTAASSTQAGVTGGGPVPSGTVGVGDTISNGDTITVDLSSFFANWNGSDFNQGSSAATGTVTNVTGNTFEYTLSWDSTIVGGPFNGQTGSWTFTGTGSISAVPVPAAVWLFGSGLIGLAGIARRRRGLAA